MQTNDQTSPLSKSFHIGQEYDQKSFSESILDSYYDIDSTLVDPTRLVEDIKTLQEQLSNKIALLRKQDQIRIPTFSAVWFARTLKHNFPEVMSLATENYMGKDLYTLETQKAPMELVYKGENCFYRTPNVFSYKLSFAPGYAWFENKTNWVTSHIDGLHYTPGTHPHALETLLSGGGKFNRICAGRDNPFFQQLTQINKESDEQIKSMLKLALRWMRTYNINDAYHQRPTKHSCPTIKTPVGIVEALDEDSDFNLPHFQITLLDTLYIIHDVLTQPWEENTPVEALLRIETFSHMVADWDVTTPNNHHPLLGLVLALRRLARYTTDHTDNTALERMQTSNEDAYREPYIAIRTNPNNRHFNTYGAWVELYHTVYAWVMLLGARDFSVAPANIGTVKPILVHDLLYPTRAGGRDYSLDAYITALCARAITPEEIPIARWFKPVTDTLPNLPKVMRLMAHFAAPNPAEGTVGHYILNRETN